MEDFQALETGAHMVRFITGSIRAAVWILAAAPIYGSGQAGSAKAIPAAPSAVRGEVLREMVDPSTGDRWLLLRDTGSPAGPGRLVLAPQSGSLAGKSVGAGDRGRPVRLVIRSGDRVIVEAHSRIADARFEAVALGPAAAGEHVFVRLEIGGSEVEVVARAAGRAEWVREREQ